MATTIPKKKPVLRKITPNRMTINRFFTERLRAPVNNPRWSWGAYDSSTNTVFLRLWTDVEQSLDGQRAWRVTDRTLEARGHPQIG